MFQVLHLDEGDDLNECQPVHATGRYFRHTVLEIMESDHKLKCYGLSLLPSIPTKTLIRGVAVNRLDRLTSGLMIMALSGPASRDLAQEFVQGTVKKEYVARVRGKFTEYVDDQEGTPVRLILLLNREEVVVDQPLLTIDRQMGLVIVTPDGKVSSKPICQGFCADI